MENKKTFWLQEALAPSGGQDAGDGAGLGFCNLSLSQSVPQAWLGLGGGGGSPAHWSLAQ